MVNPIQLSLKTTDGTLRNIIIEPVLEQTGKSLHATGVYKIYKDAFGEESTLFTEPLEFGEANDDLSDDDNPDFLGKFIKDVNMNWKYEGDLLSAEEQTQVLGFMTTH